ncbi:hypothetical protein AC26_3819 [Escherichia coli 1-176-05_S3_C2]|nr:hypothetical protein AC26_3819 [Escherichia coli 1-176-05_S3_C2]
MLCLPPSYFIYSLLIAFSCDWQFYLDEVFFFVIVFVKFSYKTNI